LVSQDKNSKVKEPLLSKKELISFLKEMLLAEDLFFFYNPTKTYISKEEIRKELKKAPEYTEELYRRYADKLIVEQMFEKEPLTDAAVQKMDFLLNYDMFKILPDIEERLAVYDILESHDEWSKVNFGPYEKKLSSKDKGWIITAYNTIRMGTSVGDIITGLTVEGLSSVMNHSKTMHGCNKSRIF